MTTLSTEPTDALPANTHLERGKYIIESLIGRGGFGRTYCAQQPGLGLKRKVAIKELFTRECMRAGTEVILKDSSAQAEWEAHIENFLREAQTLASLDDPGIVKVHDYFRDNNTAYMVMQFIEGETLYDLVMRSGRLHMDTALPFIQEIGTATIVIHNNDLIHGDLTPKNIMVTKRGHLRQDYPVLIDFGSARDTRMQGAPAERTFGTPGFMAPRLHEGIDTPKYLDVYALAATCYYLLTARVYKGADLSKEPELTDRVRYALTCAFSKSPSKRTQDVHRFMDDLLGIGWDVARKPTSGPDSQTSNVDVLHQDTQTAPAFIGPTEAVDDSRLGGLLTATTAKALERERLRAVVREGQILLDDLASIFADPELAAELLNTQADSQAADAVLNAIGTNRDWWAEQGRQLFAQLCEQARRRPLSGKLSALSENLQTFGKHTLQESVQALNRGDKELVTIFLEEIATPARATDPRSAWAELLAIVTQALDSVRPASQYSWPTRAWLLEKWAADPERQKDKTIQPWLQVRWQELGDFFALPLCPQWHKIGIQSAVSSSEAITLSTQIVQAINEHDELFTSSLVELAGKPEQRPRVSELYGKLLSKGYSSRLPLLYALLAAAPQDAAFTESLLKGALLKPPEIKELVGGHLSPLMLEDLDARPRLSNFLQIYISALELDDCRRPGTELLIQKLDEKQATQLRSWCAVANFIEKLTATQSIPEEGLREVVRSVQDLSAALKEKAVNKLVAALVSNVSDDNSLERVLREGGKVLGGSYWLLYRRMLDLAAVSSEKPASDRLAHYVKLALRSEPPEGDREKIAYLIKSMDATNFNRLDEISQKWPEQLRQRWISLTNQQRKPISPIQPVQTERKEKDRPPVKKRKSSSSRDVLFYILILIGILVLMAVIFFLADSFLLRRDPSRFQGVSPFWLCCL